jgi:hypothetical protein
LNRYLGMESWVLEALDTEAPDIENEPKQSVPK